MLEIYTDTNGEILPFGIIPRVENNKYHLEFINKNIKIKYIMIDIHRIEQFLKKNITSSSFRSDIKIISTTTIHDDLLVNYYYEKELSIINQFKPHFHIPCDFPLYLESPIEERFWFLKEYIKNLESLMREVNKEKICLIPLIKGLTYNERKLCYDFLSKYNLNYASYYGAQYFGRGRGSRSNELKNDIRSIISESKLDYILLIGLQSESILNKMPPQVRASAGLNQWKKIVNIKKDSIESACKKYNIWCEKTNKKLSSGTDCIRWRNSDSLWEQNMVV